MRLDGLARLLDRRLSVRQLFYLATMGSVLLGAYLVIGLFWAGSHHQHLHELHGLDKAFSVLGEIVAWPVLIIADVHLR
ncbi:hypothetical protein [[Mycobacterium] vasticus]|uniref:Uncharacterized protein n=1 Tax=[Mycobacterium] vasticus TaxID=2875777 RepID=A0ABU5YV65_9MYCO|nr:hypothetical protein [Mycolicibacter sp. MYC017]MEB3069008.1 hypothetical protein [Mycolicibacter sp. MYC017]